MTLTSKHMDQLNWWLSTPIEQVFKHFGKEPAKDQYLYLNRGSDIIAMAHLDTVCRLTGITSAKNDKVHATGLDDRLGAWIIMDLLPSIGLNYDIVLTDNEERGQSTIKNFEPAKTYKWAFEFDRADDDVVTYSKDTPAFMAQLTKHFKTIGRGSLSDITTFKGKCCAVNIGTGLKFGHSETSYFEVSTLENQLDRFLAFMEENENVAYPYEAPAATSFGARGAWNGNGGSTTNYSYLHYNQGRFDANDPRDDTYYGPTGIRVINCAGRDDDGVPPNPVKRGKGKKGKKEQRGNKGPVVLEDTCWNCGLLPDAHLKNPLCKDVCPYCGAVDPYTVPVDSV